MTGPEHYAEAERLLEHAARMIGTDVAPEERAELVARQAVVVAMSAHAALDCADVGFITDGFLDQLPQPSRLGAVRTGGIDLNKPRIRAVLSAALALAAAPHGFTVAEHAARVKQITGQAGYTVRQAAYDLRKLRGKNLIVKPRHSLRYHVPPGAARTIAALLALRDQVIAPVIAGNRSPRLGRKPAHWTHIDRDYENLRIGMQTLFHHLGITAAA